MSTEVAKRKAAQCLVSLVIAILAEYLISYANRALHDFHIAVYGLDFAGSGL